MEISNVNGGYATNTIYASKSHNKKQTEQVNETDKANVEVKSTRKTAADELTYLSKKFDGYSFVAGNYSQGMRYGSATTTNVAISPQFLTKMANNPKLEDEYVKEISNMKALDEDFERGQAARGWRVVDQGWAIDKNGEISSWAITTKDPNAKSHLQKMSEQSDKIREQNLEKKKQQKEIEEKRKVSKEEKAELQEKMQEIGKAQFGDKFKEAIVLAPDEEVPTGKKEEESVVGINLDMKV